MTTTSFERHGAITLGLALLACLPQAQAQSGYTMTVLSKPGNTDAVHYIPRQIDDLGIVRGVSYERAGLTLAFGPRLLYSYWPQSATWAAGNSATVTPTMGSKKFLPVFSNKQGTIVGLLTPRAPAVNGLLPLYDTPQFTSYLGTGVVRQGSVDTPFPAGSSFVPTAINNAGLIVGTNASPATNGPTLPAQLLNGVLSTLDKGDFDSVTPQSVNDSGVIVGNGNKLVLSPPDANGMQTETYTTTPVMWVNGKLSRLNAPGANEAYAYAHRINNVGQVLMRTGSGTTALWFNGTLTPLNLQVHIGDPSSRLAGPNDAGTIAGCELAGTATWPFLWKNGVQIDLAQDLASKGLKPPAGYAWGCPVAINNAGSMIIYYWKPSSDSLQPNSTVVWVRLNAKP